MYQTKRRILKKYSRARHAQLFEKIIEPSRQALPTVPKFYKISVSEQMTRRKEVKTTGVAENCVEKRERDLDLSMSCCRVTLFFATKPNT